MKNLLKKLVVVSVFAFVIICGSVVFADGAPDYNKNLYTVVVNNRDGAKVYYNDWNYKEEKYILQEKGTLPYGTKSVVIDSFKQDNNTYLSISNSYDEYTVVLSSDVEIYGEPLSPLDLRIK